MLRRIYGICCQNFCKNKGQLRDIPMQNLGKNKGQAWAEKKLRPLFIILSVADCYSNRCHYNRRPLY